MFPEIYASEMIFKILREFSLRISRVIHSIRVVSVKPTSFRYAFRVIYKRDAVRGVFHLNLRVYLFSLML